MLRRYSPAFPVSLWAIAVVTLFMSAGPAGAQEIATYRDALEEIEAGNWSSAAGLLEKAISQEPAERRRAIGRPYLPHYYLGLARFELRDCGSARPELKESERQGVVARYRHYTDLKRRLRICEARSVAAAQLERADRRNAELTPLASKPLLRAYWLGGEPPRRQRKRDALTALSAARGALASAGAWNDTEEIDAIRQRVEAQEKLLTELIDEARRTHGHLETELAQRRAELDAAVEEAKQDVRASLAFNSTVIREQRGAVLDLVAAADERSVSTFAAVDAFIADVAGATGALEALMRQARLDLEARQPPRVPALLLEAVELFFAADYAAVLEALAPLGDGDGDGDGGIDDPAALAHAFLIRAAAGFSLDALGANREDGELLSAAVRDVAAGLTAAPALFPTSDAFSPRFIEFFVAAKRLVEEPKVIDTIEDATAEPEATEAG